MDSDPWLTVEQAAERLQLHIDTVRRLLRKKELRGHLINRRAGWRVRASEVDHYITRNNGQTETDPEPHPGNDLG